MTLFFKNDRRRFTIFLHIFDKKNFRTEKNISESEKKIRNQENFLS